MIIDTHVHIGRNEHINANVDQLLHSMDKASIDKALVFAGKLNDCPNEYLLEQIAPHKDRLYGVACFHPEDKFKQSVLEDLLQDSEQIVGVKFYLGYDHWYPNNGLIYSVLDTLQQRNLPALFHCGDCLNSVKKAKLKYAHPLGVDDPAVDFPNNKFVICHVGYPFQREAAEVCYKNSNVYADISGFVYGDFNMQQTHHFRDVINEFVQIAGGTDKLLFGTDWPISNQESYIQTVRSLVLDNKDNIFEHNARKVFKI